jgi:DNA end-binding protein Ku
VTARALWKATLEVGELSLPVKLYSAVADRGVHFRLLHAEDHVPVRQQLVDPRDGREVPREDVRWGLEVEDGRLVALDGEELEKARPEPSREIEVLRFVPRAALDLAWYRRPYFLGPDGSAADCAALVEVLRASDRCGIARWVLRGDRHFGALGWRDDQLQLVELHDAAEVVSAAELAHPRSAPASAQERELAEQLVAMLDAEFDPSELRDEHRERVEKLIAAKRKGRSYAVDEPLPRPSRGELGQILRRSIRAAKAKRRAAA